MGGVVPYSLAEGPLPPLGRLSDGGMALASDADIGSGSASLEKGPTGRSPRPHSHPSAPWRRKAICSITLNALALGGINPRWPCGQVCRPQWMVNPGNRQGGKLTEGSPPRFVLRVRPVRCAYAHGLPPESRGEDDAPRWNSLPYPGISPGDNGPWVTPPLAAYPPEWGSPRNRQSSSAVITIGMERGPIALYPDGKASFPPFP
jgi:hypothetical protein